MHEEPFVSVIVPARNMESSIGACLNSLTQLDYPRDRYEIIVVDGRSTDQTPVIARASGATVVFDEGKGRAAALNIGVSHAKGKYWAFTDADCVVDRGWLRGGLRPFGDSSIAGVGGAVVSPATAEPFARAVTFFSDLLNAQLHFGFRKFTEVASAEFIAGANSIFDSAKVFAVFPVPEIIRGGEDQVLCQRVRDRGYRVVFAPDVIVNHFANYSSVRAWCRQMIRAGKARMQMIRVDRRFLRPVDCSYLLSLPIVILGGAVIAYISLAALFTLLGLAVTGACGLALLCWIRTGSRQAALRIPLIVPIAAIWFSAGFVSELVSPEWKPTP